MATPNAFDPPAQPVGARTSPPMQPLPPTHAAGTYVDEHNNIHTTRLDGTEEITHAVDGHVSVRPPGGLAIHHPPPPPRPVPLPGARTHFTLTGTDGTVLEVSPSGHRTVIEPGGRRQNIAPGEPPPPVVTLDGDGTKHIYAADGTHTIVEDFVQTVIPPQPLGSSDMSDLEQQRPPWSAPGVDSWTNDHPDGSTTRSTTDGVIESIRPDGTRVIHPPPLLPSTEADRQHTVESSVEPDGTLRHRQEDGAIVTTRPDGTTLLTAADGATLLTRPDGTRDRIPRPPDLPAGVRANFADQDALAAPVRAGDSKVKPSRGCASGIVAALAIIGIGGGLALYAGESEEKVDESFDLTTSADVPATTSGTLVATTLLATATTILQDSTPAPETAPPPETEPIATPVGEPAAPPAPETTPAPSTGTAARTFAGQITSIGGEPASLQLVRNEVQLSVSETSLAIILHMAEDSEFGFDEDATPACFTIDLDTTTAPLPTQAGEIPGQLISSGPVTLIVGFADSHCGATAPNTEPRAGVLAATVSADGTATGTIDIEGAQIVFTADSI